MKRPLTLSVLFLLAICYSLTVHSQSIIPASGCGNVIATSATANHLSSSYCAEYSTSGNTAIYGVAWDDATGNVHFTTGDGSINLPTTDIAAPAGYAFVSNPCIMIGTPGGYGAFLWVSVVYLATTPAGTSDLFMDVYPARNSFSGGLSYTTDIGAPTTGVQLTTTGNVSATAQPRGDIINEIRVPGLPDKISSDWFTLTWLENGVVHAMADNFRDIYSQATTHMSTARYATVTALTELAYPDIAGIQRDNSGETDRMGLLTYMDFSYHIYYVEWNIGTGALSTPDIIASNGKEPRIDAADLYPMNSTTATIPRYNIAYRDANAAIYQFNDKTGVPNLLISQTTYPYYYVTAPMSVLGPGNSYTTVYRATNVNDIYAQQISNVTGTAMSPDYHTVNCDLSENIIDPSASQLDNVPTLPPSIFVCGYDNISKNIWYKTTGDPLDFRGFALGITPVAKEDQPNWQLSPNPAKGSILLSTDAYTAGAAYTILDATGRIAATGQLALTDNVVDISQLSAGVYMMRIWGEHTPGQVLKLIKE